MSILDTALKFAVMQLKSYVTLMLIPGIHVQLPVLRLLMAAVRALRDRLSAVVASTTQVTVLLSVVTATLKLAMTRIGMQIHVLLSQRVGVHALKEK
jgi:hypothetical protein